MPSNAQQLIDRILASERIRASSHFSERVYADEPILTTGRHMSGYLPERYRKMRAISRWEPASDAKGRLARGRWLSEAELFWRQGTFMADWEDDCPYHGVFKSYYPTYNAMSDRQLRGYFTWRAAVRRGAVEETSLSFAYVYIYELLNGIGIAPGAEGFERLQGFWQAYRAFAPELDRHMRTWLQDYAVYHGLDRALLEDSPAVQRDRALMELQRAIGAGDDTALFAALDALSSYRAGQSQLAREHGSDLAAVCCAVFRRLATYYDKHRKLGLVESLFGKTVELPYTMFAAAVLYETERHADCAYEVDGLRRFRCRNGLWTCERVHGEGGRSRKLGAILHAVDAALREALAFEHPLKREDKLPKYLAKIIDEEIAARMRWNAARQPVHLDIDLSALAGIRSTAAELREALLVDEEREDEVATAEKHPEQLHCSGCQSTTAPPSGRQSCPESQPTPTGPLPAPQAAYLRALLASDATARARALAETRLSEDLLIDAINETLFDLLGDTAIEVTADGPSLIDDYRDDVEGLLT